jgi:RNA polymerase sigma-70 factor (ECF subfamily)
MTNKDAGYYQRLIAPIQDRMIRTIWRIIRDPDDTDDALQEALATIWKRLERIRSHPNPHAVILRICVNAAYDLLRRKIRERRRRELHAIADSRADSTPTASDALSHQERETEIFDAIARLSRNQAQAVLMRLVQGQCYSDIAQALGCSEATARIHVTRGRARLRKLLSHLAPHPLKEVSQ